MQKYDIKKEYVCALTLQVSIKEISSNALNGVIDGKNVHSLSVLNIRACVNGDNVTESNPKVAPDDLVHPYLGLLTGIVGKGNTDSILPLLALKTKKKQHKMVIKKFQ